MELHSNTPKTHRFATQHSVYSRIEPADFEALSSGMTWSSVLDAYLDGIDNPHTRKNNRLHLNKSLIDLDIETVSDITFPRLAAHRVKVMNTCLSPGSKMNQVACLRGFLFWAGVFGLHDLPENALKFVLRMPPRRNVSPRRVLEVDELRLLLSAASGQDRVAIAIMAGLGLRVSECSSLDVRDYLPGRDPTLLVRDGKRGGREMPLTSQLEGLIAPHCDGRPAYEPMILSQIGRMGTTELRRRVKEASDRAGLIPRALPHDLRHTFATRYYRATRDIVATSKLLGHRNIQVTMIYLHHKQMLKRRDSIPALPLDM